MKTNGYKTLLAMSAGATALLVSTSLLAMPFCKNNYSKRNYDPYMMTYMPGHGGYAPMQYYGYQPMRQAPYPQVAPRVQQNLSAGNTDKETAQVESGNY